MKRFLMTLFVAVSLTGTVFAMSFSSARLQALYLTDKMAYELYLTDDQYNACYEINLDYMMCVDRESDIFGYYWNRRNMELSYVLSHGQYVLYTNLEYFYRPIIWYRNNFYFVIYDRYYSKRYFRAAPYVYSTYKGGNRYYSVSPYKGRVFNGRETVPYDRSNTSWRTPNGGNRPSNNHPSNQESYGNTPKGNAPSNNGNSSFGNQKQNPMSGNSNVTQPTIKKTEAIRQSKNSNGDSWKFGARR
jgi:hypothetical protein